MRIVHFETNEIGYDALSFYTEDLKTLLGPISTSDGDTVVLVEDDHRHEIDNMNHLLGVRYLYDEPA